MVDGQELIRGAVQLPDVVVGEGESDVYQRLLSGGGPVTSETVASHVAM